MGGPEAPVNSKPRFLHLLQPRLYDFFINFRVSLLYVNSSGPARTTPPPILGSSQGRRAELTHVQIPITGSYQRLLLHLDRGIASNYYSGVLHWQSAVRNLTWSSWVAKHREHKERAPQNSDALPNSPPPRTALGHDTTSGLRHKQLLSLSMTNVVMCSDDRTASTVLEPARSAG